MIRVVLHHKVVKRSGHKSLFSLFTNFKIFPKSWFRVQDFVFSLVMKNIFYICLVGLVMYSCGSSKDRQMTDHRASNDTIKIANDSLNFELLIFEPTFDSWLAVQPPIETYSLSYLEGKNRRYVSEYNRRALSPVVYGSLYPQPINYDPFEEYGLKLNYMLFMYFEFFQEKYNQRL